MIGTEFIYGQGLGNQLFCYVVARTIAEDRGVAFATAGQEYFGDRRYGGDDIGFLDVDLGLKVKRSSFKYIIKEKEERLFTRNSEHDRRIGCDIRRFDPAITKVCDGSAIIGVLQDEQYFLHRRNDIRRWLRVKPEYERFYLSADDLCIINFRGGEYRGNQELFLRKKYWVDAMANMRRFVPEMRFEVVTDDPVTASAFFPDLKIHHFGVAGDYIALNSASYLIVSNSSFSFFPAFTSKFLKCIIAPKYWARHNVSDGYWSTPQNIYSGWLYQDRKGGLFDSEECREEFNNYAVHTGLYEKKSKPIGPGIIEHSLQIAKGFLKRAIR